ncbi:MAG: hypothetical protein LBM98_01855 [Oscillospiraceae bacterium]|nr:hypothetical protein [Oscillospiraceae bacterium]
MDTLEYLYILHLTKVFTKRKNIPIARFHKYNTRLNNCQAAVCGIMKEAIQCREREM